MELERDRTKTLWNLSWMEEVVRNILELKLDRTDNDYTLIKSSFHQGYEEKLRKIIKDAQEMHDAVIRAHANKKYIEGKRGTTDDEIKWAVQDIRDELVSLNRHPDHPVLQYE